ncbi:Nucleoside-diphosphate-sugar epimerase [Enterococcus malodoratus]|uniref:NAD-dependent epimerase/dehydratase family protein n=1 Tax=Enterococcus malodoratus TaxID=71451 RepID=UPI0008D67215|nr:NAD-dependent epimerase/dehydratase family protein [Enterococcus malodoratus]SES96468.1 Nucleoside-diphosphate-sugar epimerase [Enterococcus malodoratus]
MNKTALLLGGTGAMGIYLAPKLIEKGYEVFVTTRNKEKNNNSDLKYITGDAHDIEFLETLSKDKWDVIVDFMVYSTKEFHSRISKLLSITKHYLFLSSYRVFAESESPITESSPKLIDCINDTEYLETDEYALAKIRQERILQESNYNNWTIIRPSITYSKNRLQLATLEASTFIYRAQKKVPTAVSEDILEKRTTMTWAGDVAKMITAICNNDYAFQEDYNVVTSESILWNNVAHIYYKHANLNVYKIDHTSYLDIVGNKYQIQYDRMYNRVMDNTKILKLIGIQQEELKNVADGLSLEIQNTMESSNSINDVNYPMQGRMDGILKTRIPLDNATYKQKLKYYWNYLKFKNRG